jgi:hypothetical protein
MFANSDIENKRINWPQKAKNRKKITNSELAFQGEGPFSLLGGNTARARAVLLLTGFAAHEIPGSFAPMNDIEAQDDKGKRVEKYQDHRKRRGNTPPAM